MSFTPSWLSRALLPLLALSLACGRGEKPAPSTTPAATSTSAAPSSARAPATTTPLSKAPTRAAFGLTLGEADDAAITAWLSARGLSCPGTPSTRRTTVRYDCGGEIPASAIPERTLKGKLDQIALVRTETGPLHHVSTRTNYSIPAEAAADYNAAVAALEPILGQPKLSRKAPAEIDATKPVVWYSTTWKFADLEVAVSLLRAGGQHYAVSERWQIPGVEEEVPNREGVTPFAHGAPSTPSSSNPHVSSKP